MLVQQNNEDLDVTLPEDYDHDLSALQDQNECQTPEESYDSEEAADQVDIEGGVGNDMAEELDGELNELQGLNADMGAEVGNLDPLLSENLWHLCSMTLLPCL